MRRIAITLLFILASSPASAFVSSAGHVYSGQCNAHGMVLQSQHPVGRHLGVGADGPTVEIETVYLGKGCDAYSERLGGGEWGWANGGFTIDFPDASISFPRQEVYCPEGGPEPDFSACWR